METKKITQKHSSAVFGLRAKNRKQLFVKFSSQTEFFVCRLFLLTASHVLFLRTCKVCFPLNFCCVDSKGRFCFWSALTDSSDFVLFGEGNLWCVRACARVCVCVKTAIATRLHSCRAQFGTPLPFPSILICPLTVRSPPTAAVVKRTRDGLLTAVGLYRVGLILAHVETNAIKQGSTK